MDVDLLRPGTVPISPNTILWFEFLLDESLLQKHLQKSCFDPSPIELITKFTSVVFELSTYEIKRNDSENGDIRERTIEEYGKPSLRQLALKVLSLKVAAHIKWNFDVLKMLPFKIQLTLLQDLLYFTNNQTPIHISNISDYEHPSVLSQPNLFAFILYHRWIVRTAINFVCNGQSKIFGSSEVSLEEAFTRSPENVQKSICFLTEALKYEKIPNLLTFDCFITLTESDNEVKNNWDYSVPISKEEFCCQITYDLAMFYFFKENYEMATLYFTNCMQYNKSNTSECGFLNVDVVELEAYLLACSSVLEGKINLLQQLHISIANQYMGILNILQQDNLYKMIPIFYRITLELDIRAALSSGKFTVARDLLPKIEALNAVRCIIDKIPINSFDLNLNTVDIFIWAVVPVLQVGNEHSNYSTYLFLKQAVLKGKTIELLNKLQLNGTVLELFKNYSPIKNELLENKVNIPEILKETGNQLFECDSTSKQRLEIKSLEQQIIACYDAQDLRQLLIKIASKNTSRSIWKINPCWELPIPLQSVVVAMPKGFLQDFSFILLAKARELMLNKNWYLSLELLEILGTDVQTGNVSPKLSRLISWEVLLIKINKLLDEWPAPDMDKKELAEECKTCMQAGESVLPRTEIMEYCALCLLNLGHWDFLVALEKRWSYFEVAAIIASACQDLIKYKGNKKFSRDLWDLVLPVFGTIPLQSKRSNSGNTSVIHRDSPLANNKPMLVSFLLKLRDSTILTIIISMLARLHNVLRDESSLEFNIDYIILWPAVVSNANSYNSKAVLEVLLQILEQALRYYPVNVHWIRLMGDVHFVNGHYEESLNYYLKSLLIVSDNFSITLRNDDYVIKRMVKSCSALNCHTQAAVLCQFLEDPDYTAAFHSLAEQKLCGDATDAYYHCFWDTSILEYLVNLHHKRTEFQRRKHVIQIMGLLELNSNNNDEIYHEASNLRKSVFLRALCKQYLH